MTELYDIVEWEKCCLVMYSYDDNDQPNVHWTGQVIEIETNKEGKPNFYSFKASKFGIATPPKATHWALCLMDDLRNEILFEGAIPGPYQYMKIPVSKDKEILVRRYNKYTRFTIGTAISLRTNNKTDSRFTEISA